VLEITEGQPEPKETTPADGGIDRGSMLGLGDEVPLHDSGTERPMDLPDGFDESVVPMDLDTEQNPRYRGTQK